MIFMKSGVKELLIFVIKKATKIMFTRKDKRLSSARKRLMSQLGKRSRLGKKDYEDEHVTTLEEVITMQEANSQPPSQESFHSERNDDPQTAGQAKVSDSLLECDSVPPSSDSEYFPTPEKRRRVAIMQQPVEPVSLGSGIFVCLSSQLSAFLDQVNANMACRTPGCNGVYVPVRVVCEG